MEHETMAQPSPPTYKPVIIIGNGPSGIILSYFLAGNWPYYNGKGEGVNEMLHQRLMCAGGGEVNNNLEVEVERKSIVEMDLAYLAQDLSGRSTSPTSLLFDTLNHPSADLGLELPSLLTWTQHPSRAIPHLVIGRGPPGGTWQAMDGSVLTISLGCWMELPQLNFREWESRQKSRCCSESRATVGSVAQYYCDYVKKFGLEEYFLDESVVVGVRRVEKGGVSGGQFEDEFPSSPHLFHLHGFTKTHHHPNHTTYTPFNYLTSNLVLATGSSDKSNKLHIPGEHLPFVLHSLHDLETLIKSGVLNEESDPILVVGAGLCAADAVIAARFYNIETIHIFRRNVNDPNLIFRQLPSNMYPEYHKVYSMMKDPTNYNNYKSISEVRLTEIMEDRFVRVQGEECCGKIKVSYIIICIGSQPDLSILDPELETSLGAKQFDCKLNPIMINPYTNECVGVGGLFAMGPLVGENFVRFLQGGAVGVAGCLTRSRRKPRVSEQGEEEEV